MEYDTRTNCSEAAMIENSTCFASNNGSSNGSSLNRPSPESSLIDTWIVVVCFVYGVICLAGTFGNGLVVYVVVRYAKMRSVPNMYVLNLAISDICFLVMLPFLIVTALRKMWVFGEVLCKLFYIMTSLNWFASVFTLIVMSADRYMAVCHPVSSIRYRTPAISLFVCLSVWIVTTLFMLPICLYAKAVEESGVKSCTIQWPKTESIPPHKAFIWYAMLIGFAVPVVLISAFYVLVVVRLKACGPQPRQGRSRRRASQSQRRVTRMVLAVVTVYVACWLPYWVFQVVLTFEDDEHAAPAWKVLAFQFVTIFGYTNSVFNPLLYAFLGDNFRQTFARSVACQKHGPSPTALPSVRTTSGVSCRSNRTVQHHSLRNSAADSDRKGDPKAKTNSAAAAAAADERCGRFLSPVGPGGRYDGPVPETGRPHNHASSSVSAISFVDDSSRNPAIVVAFDDGTTQSSACRRAFLVPGDGAAPTEVEPQETEC